MRFEEFSWLTYPRSSPAFSGPTLRRRSTSSARPCAWHRVRPSPSSSKTWKDETRSSCAWPCLRIASVQELTGTRSTMRKRRARSPTTCEVRWASERPAGPCTLKLAREFAPMTPHHYNWTGSHTHIPSLASCPFDGLAAVTPAGHT
eukprot:UN4260